METIAFNDPSLHGPETAMTLSTSAYAVHRAYPRASFNVKLREITFRCALICRLCGFISFRFCCRLLFLERMRMSLLTDDDKIPLNIFCPRLSHPTVQWPEMNQKKTFLAQN